jgi:hypothetical protein
MAERALNMTEIRNEELVTELRLTHEVTHW